MTADNSPKEGPRLEGKSAPDTVAAASAAPQSSAAPACASANAAAPGCGVFEKTEDVKDGQGTGHVPFDCLPELHVSSWRSMRLFDPATDLGEGVADSAKDLSPDFSSDLSSTCAYPFFGPENTSSERRVDPVETKGLGLVGASLWLPLARAAKARPNEVLIPREKDCYALWDKYMMPGHIRRHSQRVADMAFGIARRDQERGSVVNPDAVYASALLHDLGKAYCIAHGGNHAEVGAAWVMHETRNGPVAQGVLFHVHWPWNDAVTDENFLVLSLLYADKRVTHDGYVTLDDRYKDLFERYGVTETARQNLGRALQQGKRVEAALSSRLGVDLHEYTAYRGRLVRRA